MITPLWMVFSFMVTFSNKVFFYLRLLFKNVTKSKIRFRGSMRDTQSAFVSSNKVIF